MMESRLLELVQLADRPDDLGLLLTLELDVGRIVVLQISPEADHIQTVHSFELVQLVIVHGAQLGVRTNAVVVAQHVGAGKFGGQIVVDRMAQIAAQVDDRHIRTDHWLARIRSGQADGDVVVGVHLTDHFERNLRPEHLPVQLQLLVQLLAVRKDRVVFDHVADDRRNVQRARYDHRAVGELQFVVPNG